MEHEQGAVERVGQSEVDSVAAPEKEEPPERSFSRVGADYGESVEDPVEQRKQERSVSPARQQKSRESISSFGGSSSEKRGGIWDGYIRHGSNLFGNDADTQPTCWAAFSDSGRAFLWELRRKALVTVQHPDIWLTGLLVLLVLLAATLGSIFAWSNEESETMRFNAKVMAKEVATAMSHQLDVALIPLITMRNYVKQLSALTALSDSIGVRGEPGSAPVANGAKGITHRNMTGVFDAQVIALFNNIAKDVRSTTGIDEIVMAIELAPKAVVSMIHPLTETKTLRNGKVVVQDHNGAIGHDLLNDPNRAAIAEATVPAPGVVIAGPLVLVEDDIVKTLIARLPINIPGQMMIVGGKEYECWGFVVALLDWEQLIEEVGVYSRFENAGMLFSLTRTDRVKQSDGTFFDKVVTIAESKEITASGGNITMPEDKLTFALNMTNNEWVMAVGYRNGFMVSWLSYSIVLAVFGSLVFTINIIYSLVNRKEHKLLLFRMMPKGAIVKLQKGESVIEKYEQVTIFFSDIIGFTSMAGDMTPIQVMQMLNELYTIFDALVEKFNVYKARSKPVNRLLLS